MIRILPVLLLLAVPLRAEGRDTWAEARKALEDAYFDELDPDQRDRWIEALGTWDNPDVVGPFADLVSRFGTFQAMLEAQLAEQRGKLDAYKDRPALSEQEIGLRNHYIRTIEKLEGQWRRARTTEDLLVKVVGSYREPKTLQAFLTQYEKHPSAAVRATLARACAQWHEQLREDKLSRKAFLTLKKLRADKDVAVRIAVARALGAFHRQEAFDLLTQCVKDGDWRVRAAAVQSLLATGSAEAVTVLIEAMKKEDGRLKDDINAGLQALTGQKHQFADSWEKWWRSVGQQLPKDRAAGSQSTELKAKDTAAFYGIPTRSDHICFVIDISGSMNKEVEQIKRVVITGRKESEEQVEGKTRLEVAKNELKRAVGNLNPEKYFNVVLFNQAVQTWRPEMTKASREVKEALKKDLDAVVASGTTYTLGALREAFVMAGVLSAGGQAQNAQPEIDTIFVLSDGGPTDNRMEDPKPMDPEIILESVRQWNRDAGIVIHTIAVDTEEVGTYFLKQLAAQNHGVFVERKK